MSWPPQPRPSTPRTSKYDDRSHLRKRLSRISFSAFVFGILYSLLLSVLAFWVSFCLFLCRGYLLDVPPKYSIVPDLHGKNTWPACRRVVRHVYPTPLIGRATRTHRRLSLFFFFLWIGIYHVVPRPRRSYTVQFWPWVIYVEKASFYRMITCHSKLDYSSGTACFPCRCSTIGTAYRFSSPPLAQFYYHCLHQRLRVNRP